MVRLVLLVAMRALPSLCTMSPVYIMEQADYLRGQESQFAIMLEGLKGELVI
jgi:hypothetical protein